MWRDGHEQPQGFWSYKLNSLCLFLGLQSFWRISHLCFSSLCRTLDYNGCPCTGQHVGSEDSNRPWSFLLHGAISLGTVIFQFYLMMWSWCFYMRVSLCWSHQPPWGQANLIPSQHLGHSYRSQAHISVFLCVTEHTTLVFPCLAYFTKHRVPGFTHLLGWQALVLACV